MSRINKYDYLFKTLSVADKKRRQAILNTLTKDETLALIEIVFNILKGHLRIPAKTKTKLDRHRNILRKLITPLSWKSKKRIIIQKGSGILPLILPAVAGLFSSLFGKSK